ncbi:MAG: nucleotidyltransferase family protein [Anaerolineae bacterium]|nr:nucleotidyltransferase family protein [Candidatus Roseilinea sp.]MDW8449177.1 nucleotidyltransferase family protein [Anaerolineae bacterium]
MNRRIPKLTVASFQPGEQVIWWKRIPGGDYVYPVPAVVIGATAKRIKIQADDDGQAVIRYVPPESLQKRPATYEAQTQEYVLELLRQERSYLTAEYGVKRIGVFGSYAKGSANETSDVDIIVEFERPLGFKFIEFAEHLERLLGRKVDVLTPAGLRGIRIPHIARDIAESIVYV